MARKNNRFNYACSGMVKTAKAIFPFLAAVFAGGFVYDVVKGPSTEPEETKQDGDAPAEAQE